MRLGIVILSLLFFTTAGAQSYRASQPVNYLHQYQPADSGGAIAKKWFFTNYAAINTSYTFFNGGGASMVSAPIGLQLNRRLNNNLYAFAGISAAPAYINFNRSFINTDIKNGNPAIGRYNQLGIYSRAEVGLMYINDDRTFSISGSIGIQRSSYPMFPFQSFNTANNNFIRPAN